MGFSRSKGTPRKMNSRVRHSRYADSRRPGPNCRCTSIAAPITSWVISLMLFMEVVDRDSCGLPTYDLFTTETQRFHRGSQRNLSGTLCVLCVSVVDVLKHSRTRVEKEIHFLSRILSLSFDVFACTVG